MAVHQHNGTMLGCLTPICSECGVSLCWDIDESEYRADEHFWDAWICQTCNGGMPFNRQFFQSATQPNADGNG
jgi:hypothetical protein